MTVEHSDGPLRMGPQHRILVPTIRERFLAAIKVGSHFRVACDIAGVSASVARRSIRRGEVALASQEAGIEITGADKDLADLVREYRQAEALPEHALTLIVRKVAQGNEAAGVAPDARVALEMLARRWPERWAKGETAVAHEIVHDVLRRLEHALPREWYAVALEAIASEEGSEAGAFAPEADLGDHQ